MQFTTCQDEQQIQPIRINTASITPLLPLWSKHVCLEPCVCDVLILRLHTAATHMAESEREVVYHQMNLLLIYLLINQQKTEFFKDR